MPALAVIFGVFVIVNAAVSQFFPPLYFQSLKNERETAVSYLKSIQSRPEFGSELYRFTTLYGNTVKEGVFYDDSMREYYIRELERLYSKNPSSRDINYQLSILYKQQGDEEKSQLFLDRAHTIDPAL
jgi:tetratricopeptide (TPR) repeat protein